jgi:hypothetical protein
MSRWTAYLLQALAALGEADPTFDYPHPVEDAERARDVPVDLSDDASVRAAFHSIVEGEWGATAFK